MPREFKDNLVEIKDGQPYICDESRNAVPCGVSTAPNNNKLGGYGAISATQKNMVNNQFISVHDFCQTKFWNQFLGHWFIRNAVTSFN